MAWPRRASGGPRAGWRGAPTQTADGAVRRALRGAVLLALVWVCLARLGLFDIVGVPELRWLPVGVLVGAVLGWRRWLAPLWWAGSVAVLVLLVVSATPLLRAPVLALVAAGAPEHGGEAGSVPPATDAIFVFSSAVTDGGLIAGQGPERMLHGLALARASGRPLVLSIVHPRAEGDVSSLQDQRQLVALAGLATPLLLIDSVGSTRDEAVRLAALARARGWRRVAAVTSPLHARRACAAVARVGLVVHCRPSPSRELTLTGPDPLSGTEERTRAFWLWLYEWIGWWRYRAQGWV